jgi:prefoldin subunit 5
MEHIDQIREIVNTYSRINSEIAGLERTLEQVNIRKAELEKEISETRVLEKALIDKIVAETGEAPDYYKIMLQL